MQEYSKTKDKSIIKKIRDNIQYMVSQQQLRINHLIKLWKRGDPDVSQDQIEKYIKRDNENYKYKIKELDNLEK